MKKFLTIILITLFISFAPPAFAFSIDGGGVCSCNTCVDCTAALNDNTNCSSTVKLTADIIDQPTTCIDNPTFFTNKTFDCQNKTVDGAMTLNGAVATSPRAIYANKPGVIVKNCVITNWQTGIYLDAGVNSSSADFTIVEKNTIKDLYGGSNAGFAVGLRIKSSNNTINNNSVENLTAGVGVNGRFPTSGGDSIGIYFSDSKGNSITSNSFLNLRAGNGGTATVYGNQGATGGKSVGIYFLGSNMTDNSISSNNISKLTGGNGGFGHSTSGGAGGFSAGIYFNGSNSNNNIALNTMQELIGGNGNNGTNGGPKNIGGSPIGIYLVNSSNNSLVSNVIYNLIGGTGASPTATATGLIGIYLSGSSSNTLSSNTISSLTGGTGGNSAGLYLSGSSSNTLSSNTISSLTSGAGGTTLGINIFTLSNNNILMRNKSCYFIYDISNSGTNNTGSGNICTARLNWNDASVTGCSYACPRSCSSDTNCDAGEFCIGGFCQACSSGKNVLGYAWSENIGWLHFKGDDYGVNIEDDGTMSGYAWSENLGWISFNSTELSGCPSGVCKAIVNLDTGEVSGWARACAGTVNGDCTGATRTDGWDGWIKLDGVSVNKTTGDFSGWAWGGDVVGWIHFADALYKVRTCFDFNRAPTITITKDPNSAKSFCGVDPNNKDEGLVGFEWKYDDADNDSQAQYQIQIATDSSFVNKVVDCTIPQVVSSGGTGTASATVAPSPSTNCSSAHLEIPYGGEGNWYYWRVKVQDARGKWSGASGQPGVQFDTPTHAKPWPDFLCNGVDCSTIKPFLGQTIQFTDASQLFGGASFSSWAWTFENGDPANSAIQNPPSVKFSIAGSGSKNGIGLTVTDNKPYSCSVSKSIKFYTSSPKWRGVHP